MFSVHISSPFFFVIILWLLPFLTSSKKKRKKAKKASVHMYGLAFGQLASLNAGLVKNDYIAVFLIDCQTLPDGTSCWALPVQVTFSDHDHISRSQQVKHFSWRFYLRIQLSANIVWLLNMPSRSQRYLCFSLLHVFKGDKGCVFKIEKKTQKTLTLPFSQTLHNEELLGCAWLSSCLWCTDAYQIWWPWPWFKATGMPET